MSGSPDIWTDEFLTSRRQHGDPEADELAAKLFAPSETSNQLKGRLGYNPILDLADVLEEYSELALAPDSNMSKRLKGFNPELRDYYFPMEAPEWVDADKLNLATKIWRENPMPTIGVLYAASLPACYMIKRGIPALYDTQKLKEHKYIFQRIYETAVMLDEVLSPGGICVVDDVDAAPEAVMQKALSKLDPKGEWKTVGNRLERSGAEGKVLDRSDVQSKIGEIRENEGAKRFLWGKGYIASKKVRMLHASMRFMLQNQDQLANLKTRGGCPMHGPMKSPETLAEKILGDERTWPTEELGVPINQEDLAYTLLTFAYLIPKGLEHWGAIITDEEKEAFLHLWKVVGHIMGLEEELMTDKWEDAEILFDRIAKLECGHSEDGVALTSAVQGFLETYLPSWFGINKRWSGLLIVDQLGWDRAKQILSKESQERANTFHAKVVHKLALLFARLYYRVYIGFVRNIPILNGVFENMFSRSADELILSWKSAYTRKPFYVPLNTTTWIRQRGADAEFEHRLGKWREKVYIGVLVPAVTLAICVFATLGWILFAFFEGTQGWSAGCGWTAFVTLLLTLIVSEVYLPIVFKQRPTVEDATKDAVDAK